MARVVVDLKIVLHRADESELPRGLDVHRLNLANRGDRSICGPSASDDNESHHQACATQSPLAVECHHFSPCDHICDSLGEARSLAQAWDTHIPNGKMDRFQSRGGCAHHAKPESGRDRDSAKRGAPRNNQVPWGATFGPYTRPSARSNEVFPAPLAP